VVILTFDVEVVTGLAYLSLDFRDRSNNSEINLRVVYFDLTPALVCFVSFAGIGASFLLVLRVVLDLAALVLTGVLERYKVS
jgi:hypothetical protein